MENRRALLIKQGKLLQAVGLDKAIAEKEEAIKDCEYHEYVPLHEVVSRDKLTEHKVYALYDFHSYEEAALAGIEYVIDNLI